VLIALGVGGFAWTEGRSYTALIPAAVGLLLLILGLLARKDHLRKHAMHAAAMVGLIGLLGSVPGLLKLPTLISGGEVERPTAVVLQSVMAVLCAVFVGLCVNSFIAARRRRAKANLENPSQS
jgi:hypothetical protein